MSDFIHQQPIILASASQSRIQLLRALGLQFEVIPANCDEENLKRTFTGSKLELAALLARSKAMEISQHYPNYFVIGADQLCLIGEQCLDKPMNHPTAVTHLRLLSGKTHQQISACCLIKAGEIVWQGYETATLTMRELNDKTIESYLKLEQPYQSCGAYHYEGSAKWLFKEVQGSDSTIRGLPLQSLMQAMIAYQIVLL
ncbi:TPA: nucleoside triphosphate pyrophosphatase [Legionella feeleii]